MTGRLEQLRITARLRRVLAERARYDAGGDAERAAWREERLHELRRHAVSRAPLYGRLHHDLETAPLRTLPSIGKADVVDRFDELVTDRRLSGAVLSEVVGGGGGAGGRALGRYRIGATSGSSGRPGLFPFDEVEWTALIANAARARGLAGRPQVDGRVRTAKVGSPSPWHLSRQVAATLQDPRKPSLALDAAGDLAGLVAALDRWQPHVLSGYPSVLAALAAAQLEGRLAIGPVQVFGGGEPLTAGARRLLVRAWGSEPFDQYATTEAGFVAAECTAHAGLHVLDDHVVVEVVDEAGAPVPDGTYGHHVLLTALHSRTLPLVRYRLDDVVALTEAGCPCGRPGPRLLGVAGRARELLHLPAAAGGGEVTVHPVAVTSVLDPLPVNGWQVVAEPGRLVVRLLEPVHAEVPQAVRDGLARALGAAGAELPVIEVEAVVALERPASGKASLVVVAHPEDGGRRP